MANSKVEKSSRSAENVLQGLVEKLGVQLFDSAPKDREDTLSMLKLIFDNIIQHPNDHKYRQIKLTDEAFASKVWRYSAAVYLMTMNGWEKDGENLRLKDESHARSNAVAISELLGEVLLRMSTNRSSKSPKNESNSSSSECCVFTEGVIDFIGSAIWAGDGDIMKDLLKPYHFDCLKNARRFQATRSLHLCVSVDKLG